MDNFSNLYAFLEFAKNNRKYPESTANNLKSALKIFEKVLTDEEQESIDLVLERIEEIFISVINKNKDKSIASLNTYKARLLRVLDDYKKYGANPAKLQNWRPAPNNSHISTPLLNKKDKPDNKKDKPLSDLSYTTHTPVEITITLRILPPGSRG